MFFCIYFVVNAFHSDKEATTVLVIQKVEIQLFLLIENTRKWNRPRKDTRNSMRQPGGLSLKRRDRRTNGPKDTPSYSDMTSRLKTKIKKSVTNLHCE